MIQYQTAGDIPANLFRNKKVIYGKVEKIVDGDTFRVRHYPYYPLSIGSKYEGKLTETTMSIRIYGVDCPELAHFGNPEQPYAKEASDFTRDLVDGKVVRIKLLRKDQYNRAIAKVSTKGFLPFTKKDVSLQLAEQGLATLYSGGGAEYDNKRDLLETKIASAKKQQKGIWKGGKNLETPAEYKKKVKAKQTEPRYSTVYWYFEKCIHSSFHNRHALFVWSEAFWKGT